MRLAALVALLPVLWQPWNPLLAQEAAKHIVFVTGDEEYRSEESMPLLAQLLEKEFGYRCTVLYATDESGFIAPNHLNHIGGLEALADADLMVQFTRFRALPEEQLQALLDYAQSGRPMVGFRTTTHAFLYPPEDARARWNDEYGREFFGQKWITHHGHRSTTSVKPVQEQNRHAVLRGVKSFSAPSWLYHVAGGGDSLPEDAVVLATGDSVDSSHAAAGRSDRFPLQQPVAWVREREDGQRVFFTTLGHPFDFQQESMRTLSLNGILWALGDEERIPSWGCDPILPYRFSLTDALYGGAVPGRRPTPLPQHWQPRENARIAFVGNTMAERFGLFGGFEAMLHRVFPQQRLTVRNLGWSADTVSLQPRPLDFGSMERHLEDLEVDTVFAFFGFNESFDGPAGLSDFERDLEGFVRRVRSRRLADGSYPEIILVSPTAPETLGGRRRDMTELVEDLQAYVEVMHRVSLRCQVRFLDLFTSRARGVSGDAVAAHERRTSNGIHLTEGGDFAAATGMMLQLTGHAPFPDERYLELRRAAREKARQWRFRHRAVNGYYIYGGRKDPFGSVSFPDEMERFDRLVAAHDARIHALATAEDPASVAAVDPGFLGPPQGIPSNYEKEIHILSLAEAEAAMTLAEGYRATVFASEVDFPELQNPVAMTFDGQGRLWVSVMPTYPQVQPGEEPRGKLLILEDADGDGKADRSSVYADGLHLPAGFELGDGGAYVAQQPDLLFLSDGDGDGKADTREVVLHGFGSEDSHHAISAFTWGPAGGLYMQEGTFHHSQVETPYGPVRLVDGGVFRWEPHTGRFRVHAPFGFWNPWGHVFDAWGQHYIGDASDGNNYLAAPITTDKEYERYRRGLDSFTTARVRPTGGSEIIGGHLFPKSVQGDYLISNTIGFQGIRAHRLGPDGSGVAANGHWDLLSSSDPNFRPIDLQFGPDGALYFVDWFNPLIGHMQHSLRDPKRDHSHGRVWRVTYEGEEARPQRDPELVELAQSDLTRLDAAALTRLLDDHDLRLRYRVRREFRRVPSDRVRAAFALQEPAHLTAQLERFWVLQQHDLLELEDLEQLSFGNEDPRALAAVVRTMNLEVGNARFDSFREEFLSAVAKDEAPRVRLEAVSLATRMPSRAAVEAVLDVAGQPTDRWLDYAIEQAMLFLRPQWTEALKGPWDYAAQDPQRIAELLQRLETEELMELHPTPLLWSELILRPQAPLETRFQALQKLGGNAGDDAGPGTVDALFRLLQQVDQLPANRSARVEDLVRMVPASVLMPKAADFERLAQEAKRGHVRRAALAACLLGVGDSATSFQALWERCAQEPAAFLDLLHAARLLGTEGASLRADELGELAMSPGSWQGCPQEDAAPTVGRFVRIELPGQEPLTLAEVEVWSGGRNIAPQGRASQSSEAWGGVPQRAVDRISDGAWASGSQSHTAEGATDPWWELDLGADFPIEAITIWNRTDDNLGRRLEGHRIVVLDGERRASWSLDGLAAPSPRSHHELRKDWRSLVRQASIRALFAGQQLPSQPSFADSLVATLDSLPIAERGAPWVQEALSLLETSGRKDDAARLRVTVVRVTLKGLPSRADLKALPLSAGAPTELRLHNGSERWQAMAVLRKSDLAALLSDEPSARLASEEQLGRGGAVYAKHCLSCHAADGGGLVGPDMTDDRYLHLERLEDMPGLIRDGVLAAGMTPFAGVLTPQEIEDVAAVMAALRGTVAAAPKEAQGKLVEPWESAAERLQRLGIEAVAVSDHLTPDSEAALRFTAPTEGDYLLVGVLPGGTSVQIPLVLR